MSILDSGKREEFKTGAVRDSQEGRGRCDLLPLDCLPGKYATEPLMVLLNEFKKYGKASFIENARQYFIHHAFPNTETSLLELSIHYQDGAAKYGDNNWQKGLPVSRYLSSAIRHYLKFCRGDKDEPHDRACLWNLTAIIWTCKHKPELNDYAKVEKRLKPADFEEMDKYLAKLDQPRQCGKTLQQVAFEVEKGICNKIEPTINPNEPTENKYVFVNNPTPSEQSAKFFNQSHREAWLNGKGTDGVIILNIGTGEKPEELVGVNLTELIARACGVKTSDLIKEIKGGVK